MTDLEKDIPPNVKGLIFDLDGTLVDTMPLHYRAYLEILKPYKVHYPLDIFLSRAGIPSFHTFELIKRDYKLTDMDVPQASQQKRNWFYDHSNDIELISELYELVQKYHGKLPMAVGTGSNRFMTNKVLEDTGLNRYFTHVVTSDDVRHPKPHPETFLKCASLIGADPIDCVVFEDANMGIEAAIAGGMKVIDVRKHVVGSSF